VSSVPTADVPLKGMKLACLITHILQWPMTKQHRCIHTLVLPNCWNRSIYLVWHWKDC